VEETPMKEVIERNSAFNVEDLIDVLKGMSVADPSTIYVQGPTGEHLRLALVEETLTDGSLVYHIVIQEAKPTTISSSGWAEKPMNVNG
jgi:hypothetical protein